MMSEIDKTTFWAMLFEFGISRVFLSVDFILAVVLGLSFGVFVTPQVFQDYLPHMLSISTALLSIVIAAVAILASLSDPKFISLLHKSKELRNLFFPYWLISVSMINAILADTITMLLGSSCYMEWLVVSITWRFIVFFMFLYGVLAMSYFIPNIIRMMVLLALVNGSRSEDA